MRNRILLFAVVLFSFIIGFGSQASAGPPWSTPPGWMPMEMMFISYDAVANKLAVTSPLAAALLGTNTTGAGMPASGIADFDPSQPCNVLINTAFSRRLGWDDRFKSTDKAILPSIRASHGDGANIWIEAISRSPGLNTYQAVGTDGLQSGNAYPAIFGTAGSSTRWLWDGMMDHNTYAVPFSYLTKPNQFFSAYYKIFIGDSSGKDIAPTAATTTTWGWQGPSFVFTSQTGVAPATVLESDVYSHTAVSTPISIAGGEYSISSDGGSTWGTWTAAAGTINSNDKVKVRQTSSANPGTTTTASLVIPTAYGPGTFRVTTLGQITTPAAFSFTSQAGVAISTLIESSPATVSGINAPAAISIGAGGEYAVSTDGGNLWGEWTSLAGTVANSNRVKVRQLSSSSPGVTTTVTLAIGGVTGAFVVTTGNPVTPSLFFSPVTNAPANTSVSGMPFYVTSNAITVGADSTISIAGGITPQYQVSMDNGVSWSTWSNSSPATVATGNLVRVRVVPATSTFTASTINLNLGGTVASFSVTTGYANPPSWMPMAMLNVAYDAGSNNLSVQDENTHPSFSSGALPLLTYVPAGSYDPTKPWSALNGGVAISRQLGWDDNTALHGNGITVPGSLLYLLQAAYPGAGIWIECLSKSPGLETYFADGMFGVGGTGNGASGTPQVYSDPSTGLPVIYDSNYYGMFGTNDSSTRWKWDGTMIHNVYAVPAAWITQPNQIFSATYRVYIGDSNGNDLAPDAATTEIWTWKGPPAIPDNVPDAFSFSSQSGVALNRVVESIPVRVSGLAVPAAVSISGGEYSVSTDGGANWSAYSSAPATVANDNLAKVRLTSSANNSATTAVTLTIGGVSASFTVTTKTTLADTTSPTLALSAPSIDFTSKNKIMISGTARDNSSTISCVRITLDGVLIPPDAGVSNGAFSQLIDLPAFKTYQIGVSATDGDGNSASIMSSLTRYPTGAIDGSTNEPTISDALKVLKAVVGLLDLSASEKTCADVAPLVGGRPDPNNNVDISDALVILKRVVKLVSW